MGSEASDEMLLLLQQMAALKDLEASSSARRGRSGKVKERKQRQSRRKEIGKEIRQLAKEKRQTPADDL